MFCTNKLYFKTIVYTAPSIYYLLPIYYQWQLMSWITIICSNQAVEGLLDGHIVSPAASTEQVELMTRYRDIHLRVLKLLEDARVYGHVWTTKQITCCLSECRDELKYNIEAIDCLIRNHLINMPQVILTICPWSEWWTINLNTYYSESIKLIGVNAHEYD